MFGQAVALHQRGQLAEAEALYRQVLQAQPQHFDGLHLLGVLHFQRRRYEEAIHEIDLALKERPDVAAALNARAAALKELQRLPEALAGFDKALALEPDYVDALYNRATLLQELGRLERALVDFDKAIALRPDHVQAFNNRGNALRELGRHDAAIASYDRALALRPDYAEAWYNRSNALAGLNRFEDAVASCDKAVALKPDFAEAFNNRGNALKGLRRFDEAVASYERALALKPAYVDALNNRASALVQLKRFDEALADYDRAVAHKPDDSSAVWNRSLARLLVGRWREGWADYEARWQTGEMTPDRRHFAQPQWSGDTDIHGKRILLRPEQGFGDTLMALRYVRYVREMGAHVILEAPAPLKDLFATIEGIDLATQGEALPAFDVHCPLMSLPRAFGTRLETIPHEVPYLRVPTGNLDKWQRRLPQTRGLKVGINWAGNPNFKHDEPRSIGLARMLPLLAAADVQFFSLQKDLRPGDAEILQAHPQLTQLGPDIETFADTAAIVSRLDLVISSDTALVHLAGALGKPVWVLLQFVPDWRWLLDREDSPWYPTVRLFRQERIDDWSAVVEKATRELKRLA
jgi:tetratricopeptide (TPR) repeat protein